MIERSKLQDSAGKPMTQSLFLELFYADEAVYTLKDFDYEYKGKLYPSIKRLYLEMEDTTEYEFAKTYFLGWKHWVRLGENKLIRGHIDEWREELELKLRARAVKQMMHLADEGNSYQASKWLADRGWDTRAAGRPTKEEKKRNEALNDRVKNEYSADVVRMFASQGS